MSVAQNWAFLKHFIKSPTSVGSITPSSKFLAKALVNSVDWANVNSVIELGAGTGIVTAEIDAARKPDSVFMSFERGAKMRTELETYFPNVLFKDDAFNLVAEVANMTTDNQVDCIISCLPLTSFPEAMRHQILADVQKVLKPGGYFIMYQYSGLLEKLIKSYFADVTTKKVWVNVPPAKVFYCKKG